MSAVKPVEAPMTPPALPAISNTDKMVYVWLTDYVADTAGFVYQAAGKLAYNVTPDMVHQSSRYCCHRLSDVAIHCKNDLVNITNFCHRYHQKTSKMVIFVAKVSDVHQIVFTVYIYIIL